MNGDQQISKIVRRIKETLVRYGYFDPRSLRDMYDPIQYSVATSHKMGKTLRNLAAAEEQLAEILGVFRDQIIPDIYFAGQQGSTPSDFDHLRIFLEQLLSALESSKGIHHLSPIFGDILSTYILSLQKSSGPGRESRITKMILMNMAHRKAGEIDGLSLFNIFRELNRTITISLMAKRYAVYVLVLRGMEILLREEIDYKTHGNNPEVLAEVIATRLETNGIDPGSVTDIVCGGGDVGHLPDGIYVLSERLKDESWKRLHNSSLNRGALVAWGFKKLFKKKYQSDKLNASLCNPLSFATLDPYDAGIFYRENAPEWRQSLRGFVKVTPLKSLTALLSHILDLNKEKLNLLVMALDELFASVVRKIGTRIFREMSTQDANSILINYDFAKILKRLNEEGVELPPHYRLNSREIGTGVKEICELLSVIETSSISPLLRSNLQQVVDSYALQAATVLEASCAGDTWERPHFIAITSMLAEDPYFQKLFTKINAKVEHPFTPILCVDSLELEYLAADHLFELYINPEGDKRFNYNLESTNLRQALHFLNAPGLSEEVFSFELLASSLIRSISEHEFHPASLVLVGADNLDALTAAVDAKNLGLIDKLVLIGDPDDISLTIRKAGLSIDPKHDYQVEILPIDAGAFDFEAKKASMAEVFRNFIDEHSDFVVMKGSIDSATLLHQALSIYKKSTGSTQTQSTKRTATMNAVFVLPDKRFIALADVGVNPSFRNPEELLKAIENVVDLVRKVVSRNILLKVAIVTAVEKQTPAIPSTILAGQAMDKADELEIKYGPMVVEGPLSFDLATVPEVAEEKHYSGQITGDANCLVATDINTANVLYKMFSKTMSGMGVAIEGGAIISAGPGTTPIVFTSRGDTAQTKFNSILLALAYSLANRKHEGSVK